MILVTTVKDKLSGPHTDQVVRDMLDDHGLVGIDNHDAGSDCYMMEVMG